MKKSKRIISVLLTLILCLVMTQSVFAAEPSAKSTNYNNAWYEKGSYIAQHFDVYNDNTSSVGVTFKVESSSPNSYAQMYMTNPYGNIVIYTARVSPGSGDVRFSIPTGVSGFYTVHFMCYAAAGTRVMCWMY